MPEDFLTKIHSQVDARLRELDGVVAEYERLQAAAAALDASAAVGRTSGPSGRRARATSTGPTAARGQAAAARRGGRRTRGVGAGAGAAAQPRARAGGRRRKRAPRGANRQAILQVLAGRPSGAAASELAKHSGVGRVSTYQVLTRLEQEQLVRRQERAEGPTVYVLR